MNKEQRSKYRITHEMAGLISTILGTALSM